MTGMGREVTASIRLALRSTEALGPSEKYSSQVSTANILDGDSAFGGQSFVMV